MRAFLLLVLRTSWAGNEVDWVERRARSYKSICAFWNSFIPGNFGISVSFGHIFLGRNLISASSNRHFKIHEIVPSRSRRAQKQSINPVTLDPETNSYALTSNELFSITAVPIKHTIFCLGYIIQEHEQRGKIDAARLTNEFGLPPGPIYKELIAGKSITAPDGRIIEPSLVIGTPRRARKIVILGDTCDPSALAEHAMDADVLVHEATCSNEDYAVAVSKGHSTAGMAGAFARRIRAKHLILNHFSPRGVRVTEYEESKAVRILVSQAREAFGSEFVYAARVSLARPHLLLFFCNFF